jgi:hypothetical protein
LLTIVYHNEHVVALENKLYLETYCEHRLMDVHIDETFVMVKVEQQIVALILTEDQ